MILQTLDPGLLEIADGVSTGTKIFAIIVLIIMIVLPSVVASMVGRPDKQRQKELLSILNLHSVKLDALSGDIKLLVEQIRISVCHYDENLSRRQVDELIRPFLSCYLNAIFLHVREVVNKNHVDQNEAAIKSKLRDLIKTSFTSMFRALSYYKYDRQILTSFINKSWPDEVTTIVEKYVFNSRMSNTKKLDEISSFFTRKEIDYSDEFISKIDILNE